MRLNLRAGSPVAVVAPAGPAPAEPFQAGLKLLSSRYRIIRGAERPGADPALPYLAGSDQQRSEALNLALNEDRVEAIFFARGGYGCSRILDRLDGDALVRRRIPMVGFSDITALHAWASCLGVPSVHGPVVTQLPRLPAAQVEDLFRLLEGGDAPQLKGLEALAGGHAEGTLWGGNLMVISHLCGTPHLPDLSGRVLLLEEVNEAPYRIDRMLTQLGQAGVLEMVSAVVVGDLTGCEDPRLEIRTMLADRLGGLGKPVLLGAPVGHGDRNQALPLGWKVKVDGSAGSITYIT